MEFTFGIITAGGVDEFLRNAVETIRAQRIPRYEILIVGGSVTAVSGEDVRHIPFDETVRANCLNKKKNIILLEAACDYVCILHDYVVLEPGWYEGFVKKNTEDPWIYGGGRVLNKNGERYRDLTLFRWGIDHLFPHTTWIPYDTPIKKWQTKLLYVPGYYFVCRREVVRQHLTDERLVHQQGEDVEHSHRLSAAGIPIQFNEYSAVRFLKQKGTVQHDYPLTPDEVKRFMEIEPEECKELFQQQRKFMQVWLARSFGITVLE